MKKKSATTNKVVCEGCCFLISVGNVASPLCIAAAYFVDSPLKKNVDIMGIEKARTRNVRMNCRLKRKFTFYSLQIKMWLKRDCKTKGVKYYGSRLREFKKNTEEEINKNKRSGSERRAQKRNS